MLDGPNALTVGSQEGRLKEICGRRLSIAG
jgi:hypothetical protein